jgi:acetyl-CoA carboxylase beta subunit
LDEDHVQRHFYYFFDYRAKYPANHLRLLFIANRIVTQHKEFLDEHGLIDIIVHRKKMREQISRLLNYFTVAP